MVRMMVGTNSMELTWRLLWCHAAYQIITGYPVSPIFEPVQAGYGWGLHARADHRRALLVHPSGAGRERGDLSLTILGDGTYVILRGNRSYPTYLVAVTVTITTALERLLAPATQLSSRPHG